MTDAIDKQEGTMASSKITPLNRDDVWSRIHGCWVGKAVGGTLGQPWEGKKPPRELTFYDPAPEGMLGNDDLDLQIAWLDRIRQEGLPIDRRMLAGAWPDHIANWPDEYGVCQRNLAQRLWPPMSGGYDNHCAHGMGGAIRTELWACLAPGDPDLAAHLASEDSCCDHSGEGLEAAVFLATIQAAAFIEQDRDRLIALGLEKIEADGRLSRSIRFTIDLYEQEPERDAVLAQIVDRFGTDNFTDVCVNLPIIVLAWLIGGDDFDAAMTAAVNCGQDTDCTCASLGAILGIIAPDSIGEHWLKPIGEDLVLSCFMTAMSPPRTLTELTDEVLARASQVLKYYRSPTRLERESAVVSPKPLHERITPELAQRISLTRPVDRFTSLIASDPIALTLQYPHNVRQAPGHSAAYQLTITNVTKHPMDLSVRLHAQASWSVASAEPGRFENVPSGGSVELAFQATPRADDWRPHANRLLIELNVKGIPLRYEAGLLMTIPARRWALSGDLPDACPSIPDTARACELTDHIVDLEPGESGAAIAFDVKLPAPGPLNLVAMHHGVVRLWWNDDLLIDDVGPRPTPPVYRRPAAAASVHAPRGEHRLTIAVGGAPGERGQLMWSLGKGNRRGMAGQWYIDAEYRPPK